MKHKIDYSIGYFYVAMENLRSLDIKAGDSVHIYANDRCIDFVGIVTFPDKPNDKEYPVIIRQFGGRNFAVKYDLSNCELSKVEEL